MEIINKKHESLVQRSRGKISLTFKYYLVYISIEAIREFKLKKTGFIHFINDGKDWSFIQNDDPDGFNLVSNGKSKVGWVINSRGLVSLFMKQTGHKPPCSFYISKTENEYKGKPVFQIITDKTIEQLIKEN